MSILLAVGIMVITFFLGEWFVVKRRSSVVFRFWMSVNKTVFSLFYSLQAYWCRFYRRPRTFVFGRKRYRYFCHPYNFTHKNERAVEVPIVVEIVQRCEGKRILEIGNCLSHYIPVRHEVVDKYEAATGVINQDVIDFAPGRTYDLIVSISTLEHVGFDKHPQEPDKPLRAIWRLTQLLRPGGMLVATILLGVNPSLDRMLECGKLRFTRRYCFKRLVPSHVWKEIAWEEIRGARYGHEYLSALGLVIGIIKKKTSG